MWQRNSYGRRVLISGSPHSWQFATQQYAALKSERDALAAELIEVKRHRDSILAALHELRADVQTLRREAEQRVAELHRERAIARARAAERA